MTVPFMIVSVLILQLNGGFTAWYQFFCHKLLYLMWLCIDSCINIPLVAISLWLIYTALKWLILAFWPDFSLPLWNRGFLEVSFWPHVFSQYFIVFLLFLAYTPHFTPSVPPFHPKIIFHHSARLYPIILILTSRCLSTFSASPFQITAMENH